jgi:hypothetical protein
VQFSQKEFIQTGLLTAGLFNLELTESVLAQRAYSFPLAPGFEINAAQPRGTLFLLEFTAFALADCFPCLA